MLARSMSILALCAGCFHSAVHSGNNPTLSPELQHCLSLGYIPVNTTEDPMAIAKFRTTIAPIFMHQQLDLRADNVCRIHQALSLPNVAWLDKVDLVYRLLVTNESNLAYKSCDSNSYELVANGNSDETNCAWLQQARVLAAQALGHDLSLLKSRPLLEWAIQTIQRPLAIDADRWIRDRPNDANVRLEFETAIAKDLITAATGPLSGDLLETWLREIVADQQAHSNDRPSFC
jgi:hypothetical protein